MSRHSSSARVAKGVFPCVTELVPCRHVDRMYAHPRVETEEPKDVYTSARSGHALQSDEGYYTSLPMLTIFSWTRA